MNSAAASRDPGNGKTADGEQDQQPEDDHDAYLRVPAPAALLKDDREPPERSGGAWMFSGAPTGVTGRGRCGCGCGRRCGW
jgi:hypothetical protein